MEQKFLFAPPRPPYNLPLLLTSYQGQEIEVHHHCHYIHGDSKQGKVAEMPMKVRVGGRGVDIGMLLDSWCNN